jgi:hypothetical protein
MEIHITKTRDEWIDLFKQKWDERVRSILDDKQKDLSNLDDVIERDKKTALDKKNLRILEITRQYNERIKEIDASSSEQRKIINGTCERRLQEFLDSNLKKPSIYNSVCSYILSFKKPSISDDSEPELITYLDIAPTAPPEYGSVYSQ